MATDDIVTRLREEPCGETWCDQCRIYSEAAELIERLRVELQLAHSQIAIMATAKVKEEPF